MQSAKVTLCSFILILCLLGSVAAQNWQTIYQTDYSSDPGWATSNPTNYHWDSPTQTYFTNNFTNSGSIAGDWATTNIIYSGESFRLTFDAKPARVSGDNGDVCVGLLGPNDAGVPCSHRKSCQGGAPS